MKWWKFFIVAIGMVVGMSCFVTRVHATSATEIPISGVGQYSTIVNNKLYVPTGNGLVYVIDTTTDTNIATISVGSSPINSATVGSKVYVVNQGSNSVSVIDSTTDTVTATISVGSTPNGIVTVGSKIYVVNRGSNSVSVINSSTDTVISTISVGNLPELCFVANNKVYVLGLGFPHTISVINTTTDTVSSTISARNFPYYAAVAGNKMYVTNYNDSSVSVIDITTDSILGTISVGVTPAGVSVLGNKVYVANQQSRTVSVINTATDTVTATVTVGTGGYYLNMVLGTNIYITDQDSGRIYVFDTLTNTHKETISLGHVPVHIVVVGNKLYILASGAISVIDTTSIDSVLPNLVSFSTSTSSGLHTTGESIPVTAHFGKTLQPGSTMTVLLNSGASVTLNTVSGSSLSGTYVVGSGDSAVDLAVESITSASVTDTDSNTRTSYELPYSLGTFVAENSLITRNLGDSVNISINVAPRAIATGSHPYQVSSPIGGYVYVANQGAASVSVIDSATNTIVDTIDVGQEPYGLAYTNGQLYVANTLSNTVSVIDTNTRTVTDTIAVGFKPYYVATIGNTVYVTNGGSNTVSVINSNTNTVTATIPVGAYPRGIKAHGTDLYVANYGDLNYSGGNSISVIDSNTNTVTTTILLPIGSSGSRGVTVLGTKVYVANFRSDDVSVIDTNTNTITATISVGKGPRGMAVVGTNIYVENFDDSTISVIDSNTNTVSATIDVGNSPAGMGVSGTDIYVSAFQDDRLYVLNTLNNTLRTGAASTTNTVSDITETTATFNGTITATGGSTITSRGFRYGTSTKYGSTSTETGSFSTGVFNASITGLACSTTYYVQSYASNTTSTGYGDGITFDTAPCIATTYTLSGSSQVYLNTESDTFTVTPNGVYNGSITITPTGGGLTDPIVLTFSSSDPQTFTITPIELTTVTLTPSNDGGLSDPELVSYTVLGAPYVITHDTSAITKTTATLNGELLAIGDTINVPRRGFQYGLDEDYGTETEELDEDIGFGVGSFTTDLSDLVCETTYHFRAYADNQYDRGYSPDTTFTTASCTDPTPPVDPADPGPSGGSAAVLVRQQLVPTICQEGEKFSVSTGRPCTTYGPKQIPVLPVTPTTPAFTRTLKLGTKGIDVQDLQRYLNSHSFIISPTGAGSPGKETTLFGTKTKAAVMKFQMSKGLKADGVVGPMTRAVMK